LQLRTFAAVAPTKLEPKGTAENQKEAAPMSRISMIALAVMTVLGALAISSGGLTGDGSAFAKSQPKPKPKPKPSGSSGGAAGGIVSEGQGYGLLSKRHRGIVVR
jgi:hypothetical protein